MNADFLTQLTVKELQALARDKSIDGRSKMRKAELVAALLEAAAPAGDPAPLPVEAPPAASSPAKQAASTPIDKPMETGLPIPEHYGQDRLVLLPQDPHHAFAYWELTGAALERARRELGESGSPLLVLHSDNGSEQRVIDLNSGNYYLTVQSGARYWAELALRSSDGRVVPVIASDPIQTPAAGPSLRSDETWMAIDEHFQELLHRAGLPGTIGSSAELVQVLSQRERLWRETGVYPISSAELQQLHQLSSGALSSWSSHSVVRHS